MPLAEAIVKSKTKLKTSKSFQPFIAKNLLDITDPAKNKKVKPLDLALLSEKTEKSQPKAESKGNKVRALTKLATPPAMEESSSITDVSNPKKENTGSPSGVELVKEETVPDPKEVIAPTIDKINIRAKKSKQHDSAENQKIATEKASIQKPETVNEKLAQKHQVEEISEQDTEKFNAIAFKEELKKTIAESVPSDEETAEKFKPKSLKESVTEKVKSSLDEEKQKSVGAVEQASTKIPEVPSDQKTSARPVPLIKEKAGSPPKLPVDSPFSPAPLPESLTNMDAEAAKVDEPLEKNNVSEEFLQRSNEPNMVRSIETKNEAQEKTKNSTKEYQQLETPFLKKNKQKIQKQAASELGEMHDSKSKAFKNNYANQLKKKDQTKSIRDKVTSDLNSIYTKSQSAVERAFFRIEIASYIFDQQLVRETKKFSLLVEKLIDENDGWGWWGKVIKGEEILEGDDIFLIAKETFNRNLDPLIDKVAKAVSSNLNIAMEAVAAGRKQIKEYWEKEGADVKRVAADIFDSVNGQYDKLEQDIDDKESSIIKSLSESVVKTAKGLEETFKTIQEENKSWLQKAQDAVVAAVGQVLAIRKQLMMLYERAASYAERIMDDPFTFFNNLVEGIGQGFRNFGDNIGKHLISGVLGWLTGSMSKMGIELPSKFDLKGVFWIVMQILGVTVKKVKKILKNTIGEKRFKLLEKGGKILKKAGSKMLMIFSILKEKGVAGLWDFLMEELSNLKSKLLETVRKFIIEVITKKAMALLLSLLVPAAAVLKAVQGIISFIVTLFKNASKIMNIIVDIVNVFGEILNKNLSRVATLVESILVKALTLAITFLVAVLGLNGIARKVKKLINEVIRPKVDKALLAVSTKIKVLFIKLKLDKAIDKMMEKIDQGEAWVNKKKEKGKQWIEKKKEKVINKFKKKNPDENAEEEVKDVPIEDLEVGKTKSFEGGKEHHKIYFKNISSKSELIMESEPKTVRDLIEEWKIKVKGHEKEKELEELISKIESKLEKIESDAHQVFLGFEKVEKDPSKIGDVQQGDERVELGEDDISKVLARILNILVTPSEVVQYLGKKVSDIDNGKIKSINIDFGRKLNDSGLYDVDSLFRIRRKDKNIGLKLSIDSKDGILKEGTVTKPEHTDYAPKPVDHKFVKDGFEITYTYDLSGKYKDKTFKTLIDFGSEVDSGEYSITSEGTKLTKKAKGDRGRTASSGEIMSDEFSELVRGQGGVVHSAHLIADWFSGSGYKSAKNTVPTSKKYNTGDMYDVENKISDKIGEDRTLEFEMTVTANQVLKTDNDILKAIKKEVVKNKGGEIVNFALIDTSNVEKFLNSKADPQYTKSVSYTTSDNIGINESISVPDKDMKDFFNIS